MVASTAYIYTSRGIIAIQATPQTLQNAGRQIDDDVGCSRPITTHQITALQGEILNHEHQLFSARPFG